MFRSSATSTHQSRDRRPIDQLHVDPCSGNPFDVCFAPSIGISVGEFCCCASRGFVDFTSEKLRFWSSPYWANRSLIHIRTWINNWEPNTQLQTLYCFLKHLFIQAFIFGTYRRPRIQSFDGKMTVSISQVGDCAVYLWATKGSNLVYKLGLGTKWQLLEKRFNGRVPYGQCLKAVMDWLESVGQVLVFSHLFESCN